MLDDNELGELGELKSLLFEDEIDSFNKLEKQIEQLRLEYHTIDDVILKITPLLDDILLKRFAAKDERTVEIYAKYLASIIRKSAKQDLPELSKALQPVLSPAIAKEIEDNQEKMVDALYPIMGGMISKYVTNAIQEMMEKINRKIEDGLSLDSYKRKMKSKVSGVSETELLLHEGHYALIRSFFIIDKETSLLVAEEHLENQEIDDPHMVASMASAIKDFVNDWIANHKEHSEVQLLSYGSETLYIESAGSVYLIAFLNAEPDHEQRREIQQFFARIVKKYYTFFQNFDGDDSHSEALEIKRLMQDFLGSQIESDTPEKKKKSNFAKYLMYLLLALFIGYLGFVMKDKFDRYQLEQRILERTGEHVSIVNYDDMMHVQGYVKSIEKYQKIEDELQKNKGIKFVNEIYLSPSKYMQQIDKLEKQLLNMQKRMYTTEKNIKQY